MSNPTAPAPETRSLLLNSAWVIGGALARYTLAALTTLTLAYLLTPQDFGLVAITAVAQLLIAHVLPVGFHDALIQRPRLDSDELHAAFWSVNSLAGFAVLLIALAATRIAALFGQSALAALLIAATGAAGLRALSTVPRALLARRMDFRTLTLARLAGQLLGSVAAVLLAFGGAGAWSLLAQVTLMHAVAGVIVFRAARWRPALRLPRAGLRHLWAFAPSVSLFTALSHIITRSDDLLIGYRLGATALGYYALAYGLMAWVVRDVLGGAATVLYPALARRQEDRARLRQTYLSSLRLAAWFAYPTLVLLAVTMPVGVRVLLGARWLPLVLPAQILALAGLREATGMFNGGVYRALGVPHLHTLLALVSAPCYVVAFLVGVNYGVAGVAFFFLLTGALLQPVAWWLLWRVSGVTPRHLWHYLRDAALVAALMGVLAALILHFTRGAPDGLRLLLAWSGGIGAMGVWKGVQVFRGMREVWKGMPAAS